MKVLFISLDLLAGNLACLLKNEGHEVKLYIQDKKRRGNLGGMVEKTSNWKRELRWVGKDGLIVFDDNGFGKIQDSLRSKGYKVFGGTEEGDLLENDRKYGQEVFEKCGLTTYPTEKFNSLEDAIKFIHSNEGPWVIKQNEKADKSLNYVGRLKDGRDVIRVLENYTRTYKKKELYPFYLQRKATGVEIACCRYFNGKNWVGPIELSIEHKKFFPGDLGPTTGEMGTLTHYIDDENNKLFQNTLAKMTKYLRSINYRGVFDINSIVNESEVCPLEATTRFGNPIVHLQSEFYYNKWGEYLYAVASGKDYDLQWKQGYGVVLFLVVPPFPYSKKIKNHLPKGTHIYFDNLSKEEMKHVHFEDVAVENTNGKDQYYISDNRGYVLYVTEVAPTVKEAQTKVHKLARKIVIPKVMYRHDIGTQYIQRDNKLLKKWGYI